jgi:CheY-like chemotaxis protein
MCPERASVAIIEDDRESREGIAEILEGEHHTIFGTAASMAEAQTLIGTFTDEAPDVVLVDGNLTYGKRGNTEGDQLATCIRAAHPDLTVIGIPSAGVIPGATMTIGKAEGPQDLMDAVLAAPARGRTG